MSFETISDGDGPDYEVWTCDRCGHQITLTGVGGDVSECPECLRREYEAEADRERAALGYKRYTLTMTCDVWGKDDDDAQEDNDALMRRLRDFMRSNGYPVKFKIRPKVIDDVQ
jgi:hypothetical protein